MTAAKSKVIGYRMYRNGDTEGRIEDGRYFHLREFVHNGVTYTAVGIAPTRRHAYNCAYHARTAFRYEGGESFVLGDEGRPESTLELFDWSESVNLLEYVHEYDLNGEIVFVMVRRMLNGAWWVLPDARTRNRHETRTYPTFEEAARNARLYNYRSEAEQATLRYIRNERKENEQGRKYRGKAKRKQEAQ